MFDPRDSPPLPNLLVRALTCAGHDTPAACVADMLYNGIGCLRNHPEALRFYLRAANAGDASAANAVGLMHELGRGVARNLSAAKKWYARAAELG